MMLNHRSLPHLFMLALLAATNANAGIITNNSWTPSGCGPAPTAPKIESKNVDAYPVLDLNISSVTANAAANISVPSEVSTAAAPKVTVTADQLAPGVFYLRGGTHHSVAIEQSDHVILVEAPLNEARSEALIAKIKEIIPGKPIQFVVNTHQHFDHSGGLRTFVDAGATIVTHQTNKAYYEKVWAGQHSINPDRLAKSQKAAKFKTFTDEYTLNDGHRLVEIYQIANSGHNDAFALVYLPAEKILIEADAFTPTAVGAPLPSPINPYTVNLYDNIKRLNLNVDQIAGLHGPHVVKLADLKAAIGQ
jgi:glyoxylase-like metal-dependent hydrolase (beta-lactamase superfamily II)